MFDAFPSVVLAYIFGSVSAGRAGPLSDIDFAFLLDQGANPDNAGELQDALCRRLHTDRFDLVDLRKANSAVAYEVIRTGTRLLCRDESVRQNFESQTVLRYLDFQPIREQMHRIHRRHILKSA